MVMLKFEDYIFGVGSSHEYINSEQIFRIRIARKRIYIWRRPSMFGFIFVEKNSHNIKELEKIGIKNVDKYA